MSDGCRDLLKLDHLGREVMSEDEEEVGKSSPRWHCPQKAVAAQAATAALSG